MALTPPVANAHPRPLQDNCPTDPPKTQLRAPALLQHPTLSGLRGPYTCPAASRSTRPATSSGWRPLAPPASIAMLCAPRGDAVAAGLARAARLPDPRGHRCGWPRHPAVGRPRSQQRRQRDRRRRLGRRSDRARCHAGLGCRGAHPPTQPRRHPALAARAGSRPPALGRLLARWLRPPRPHEAGRLHLQIDKAHHQLGWQPRWRAPARMGTGS